MGQYPFQRKAGEYHLGHLVPGLVHAPTIDAVHLQALEDDVVPFDACARGQDPEQRDLAAVIHRFEQVVEGLRVARHLQADIEAIDIEFVDNVQQALVAHVDGPGRTHVGGQLQPIVVDVADHDVASSDVAGDAGGNHADRSGSGDQHVFADQIELQRAVCGVAEGVEEGRQFAGDGVRDWPEVGCRYDHVLGEGAVAVDADALGVRTQMLLAGAAVAAHAADHVAFGRDPLAFAVAGYTNTDLGDPADKFVADHQWRADRALRPLVPEVNMQVGTADRGLLQADQHFAGAWRGDRHLAQFDSGSGGRLDQRAHRATHGVQPRFFCYCLQLYGPARFCSRPCVRRCEPAVPSGTAGPMHDRCSFSRPGERLRATASVRPRARPGPGRSRCPRRPGSAWSCLRSRDGSRPRGRYRHRSGSHRC